MSRLAYIWILAAIGFAFWFHANEESQRREDISRATKDALRTGARTGCRTNNDVRQQIEAVAERLHPQLRVTLQRQNCDATVRVVIRNFEKKQSGGD
jgi:hypothetical protein